MKNKVIGIIIAGMFLLTIFSNVPVSSLNNNEAMESGSIAEKKKWTFMIYEDEDFPNPIKYDVFLRLGIDFAKVSNARSGKNLNVIILRDTFHKPGKLWYVNERGGRRLLENLGEVDMGEYETLRDFVAYCKENFPAEHYFLDIFNHGAGWIGACVDETNNNDWLTMKEIRRALTEVGGVDIISFITPCLMATVESVYELRNCAEVYIGKQPIAYFSFQVVGPLCDLLNKEYYLSNIDIGKKTIDFYKDKVDVFPWSVFTGKALSAMRTDEVTDLVGVINNLSIILTNNITEYIDDIRSVVAKTEAFPTKRSGASDEYKARAHPEMVYIDIYDFVNNYLKLDGVNETLRGCLQEVMECINKTVIAENHTNDHPEAHGLNIYFPDVLLRNIPEDDYTNSGLDFIDNTSWDEFLIKYHSFYATVDDDGNTGYTNIQEAIDNSSDSYVVYIKNGVYHENIVVSRSITLVGESKDATIIDGGQSGDVVTITADSARLFFLGIKNSSDRDAGVFICGNSTIMMECNISNNHIGIYLASSVNNELLENRINNNYLGIYLNRSNDNKFSDNYLENNKIDARFLDSSKNNWKNIYLDHPNRHINLILGFKTINIGKYISFKLPLINLNLAS